MGKLSIPVSDTTAQQQTSVNNDNNEVAQISDIEIERNTPQTDDILGDDLSITNEALRLIPLKQFFGIDATNTEHDAKIKSLIEWAKNKGVKNRNQLWSKLREVEYKLGVIDGSDAKLEKMYEYARIDGQITGLVNKLGAITNGK